MTRRRKGVVGLRAVVALLLTLLQLIASSPASAQAAYETDYRWDAMGRLTGVVQPDADGVSPFAYPATRYTWDSDGQLTKVETGWLSAWPGSTVPSSWSGFTIQKTTNFTYDPVGNRTDERLSGGSAVQEVTQYSYDPGDRLTCTAVRMNMSPSAIPPAGSDACQPGTALGYAQGSDGPDRITKSIYDAADEVLQVRKAVGVTGLEQAYVTYTYTPNGKQQDVIDANGNHAKLTYDAFDRKYQWQFPSSGTPPSGFNGSTPATAVSTAGSVNTSDYEQWTYDSDGNLYIDRKRDGRSVVLNYDALNRRYTRNYRNASGVDDPTSTWVYYAYDLRGLQTGATLGSTSGAGVTDTFDNAGRLQSATDTTGGAALTLNYLYDANSNRIRITHPDGQYFVYDYDQLNRVKDIKEDGGTALVTIAYYNTGERQSLTRAGGSVTSYGYDGISRLTSLAHSFVGGSGNVTIGLPAYNAASQITTLTHDNSAYIYTDTPTYTRPYSINGLNQYSQTGPAASPTTIFGYDADGNLLTSKDTASQVTTTYSYDVENRLTGASGGLTATLSYDPNGRLYQTSGASGTTRLLYDGDALVAEYNGSTLLRRYVHGPGVDEPMVWYEGAGVSSATRRFLLADNEGSIVAVGNSSGGSMQTNTYDEYGIPGAHNSSLANQRFAYTGQILIPELGLYHYKARAYSPILGRFMQTDPVGYEDDVNLYDYVKNDPIDGGDPNGTGDSDYANLSQCVYDTKCPGFGKYQRVDSLDTSSGLRAATFSDGKRVVVAFAGTDPRSGKDILADAAQALGFQSKQYREAAAYAKSEANTYGAANITFTGHSLGGGLATLASSVTGAEAVTFNPAGVSESTFERYGGTPDPSLIRNYIVRGDPLTNTQRWTPGLPEAIGQRTYLGSYLRTAIAGGVLGWLINHPISTVTKLMDESGK